MKTQLNQILQFQMLPKNPLSPQIHLGIESDGGWTFGFSDNLENIKHCFRCKFVPYCFSPFFADFLKGPQRFLLSTCVIIYSYMSGFSDSRGPYTL